jgi:hypothetical protein
MFRRVLGQTETYVSRFGRLLIHDDGALDIYIYYIVNCRDSRGQNICWPMQLAVQKLCFTSQKLCQKCLNLPRHRKEVPVKHMFWAPKTYVLRAQNICFEWFDPTLRPLQTAWKTGLQKPNYWEVTRPFALFGPNFCKFEASLSSYKKGLRSK